MSDDDEQIILKTNADVIPLIFWYNYYDNDNSSPIEEISFKEKISSEIKFYDIDKDKLIKDIKSLSQMEKVFLILRGKDAENILDSVVNLPSLDSIFIYCLKKNKYAYLKIKYPKIVDIINHPLELIHVIEKQRRRLEMQQITLSLYADKNLKTVRFFPTGTSTSFVWYQLLKNMICLDQAHNSRTDAKLEMIKLCEIYHSHKDKKQIYNFESEYSQTRPIQWYTKDTFLYRFVNRLLRTGNISDLFVLRFYIADLSNDLKNCQQEQIKNNQIPSRVYRGQRVTMDEIEQFQANRSCLISSNGYLSTTENFKLAEIYAGLEQNQLSIIFEIEITETASTRNIFASIYEYSQFPEERELLFDIGTVFKLQSIKRYKNRTWLARLELSNKEQEQADTYIKYKMKEFQHLPIQLRIGQILIEVGEYQQAKKYLKDLQNKLYILDKSYVTLHKLLGIIEMHLNNYDKSLKHLKSAYNACPFNSKELTNLVSDLCYFYTIGNKTVRQIFHPLSLSLHYGRYRHMYAVYQQLEMNCVQDYLSSNYAQSLNTCFYMLKRYRKKQTDDYLQISRILKRISEIYTIMNQPALASKFHQCSMDFFQYILPSEHPQLKQSTDNQTSSAIDVNETTDSIICEYYLPITQKVSRYTVEFENEIKPLIVQPLETLYDIKLKIKKLYPENNKIDCFIIDEKGTKVRHFICRTQLPIVINVDPDAATGHKSFQLNINRDDRIEDLQDKIEQITEIPFYQQNLRYQDQYLLSYKLIFDYGIEDNSTIILEQDGPKNTTVNVDIIPVNDDLFQFQKKLFLQSQTVFDLKKDFENLLGIPVDDQELLYNDIMLNEHKQLLQYYEIQENTNLTLNLKQCCLPRKIFIEYSRIHICEIQPYKTIENLKQLIENQLKIESKYQKLTVNDMELEENRFINTINQDSQMKLIDRRLISVQIYIKYQIQERFITQKYKNDDSEDIVDYKNDLRKFLLTKQNISIPLSLKLGDTIKHVKRLIEEKEKICIEHQTLSLFEDKKESYKRLYDGQSLIDCDITDQTTLELILGDLAVVFIGTGEDQQGPFLIEMIDEENHRVSNIKMKLVRRYDIIDIDSKSLYKSKFINSKQKCEHIPLLDTNSVEYPNILILKPRPTSDSTSFEPSMVHSFFPSLESQVFSQSIRFGNNNQYNANDFQSAFFKEYPYLENMNHSPFNRPETLLHK